MKILKNPFRGTGLPISVPLAEGHVRTDPSPVLALLQKCPAATATPLVQIDGLAGDLGVGSIAVKDERGRMGLGSFKALGASYAIAKEAYRRQGSRVFEEGQAVKSLNGVTYVAATAGNHGLSIAAGARIFGAAAVIYVAQAVPQGFVERLEALGAKVVRNGEDYTASLIAAKDAAEQNGWQLLSDTSWPGYTDLPLDIMEGYLVMASEAVDQANEQGWRPTHVFLQAGVGGLAAAAAAHLRLRWADGPMIYVVEPEFAPALQASIAAGTPVFADGPQSNMGRLDCKEPSHLALKCLAKDADGFVTVSDKQVSEAIKDLSAVGLETSPSGGAGYAALKEAAASTALGLGPDSKVLLFLSEGPADD